jgi:hypothetical protein
VGDGVEGDAPVGECSAVEHEVRLGAGGAGVVVVACEGASAGFFEGEGAQGGSVGDLELGVRSVISTELEEELVGEGFDGVSDDEGVVADELAA